MIAIYEPINPMTANSVICHRLWLSWIQFCKYLGKYNFVNTILYSKILKFIWVDVYKKVCVHPSVDMLVLESHANADDASTEIARTCFFYVMTHQTMPSRPRLFFKWTDRPTGTDGWTDSFKDAILHIKSKLQCFGKSPHTDKYKLLQCGQCPRQWSKTSTMIHTKGQYDWQIEQLVE